VPKCFGCKEVIKRSEEPRLKCTVPYKTKFQKRFMEEKLQLHCNSECVLRVVQPDTLADRPVTILDEFVSQSWTGEMEEVKDEVVKARGGGGKKKKRRKRTAD